MGLDGISVGSLVLVLVIVMLLFGTKRIRGIGEDLGAALRSFKKGVKEVESETAAKSKTDTDPVKPATDDKK